MITLWAGFIFCAGLLFGVILGGFLEYSNSEKRIRAAYREQEELRGVIYALNKNLAKPSRGF